MFCPNAFPRERLATTLGVKLKEGAYDNWQDKELYLLDKVHSLALTVVNPDLPEAIYCSNDLLLVTMPVIKEQTMVRMLAQLQLKHPMIPETILTNAKKEKEIYYFCQGYYGQQLEINVQ